MPTPLPDHVSADTLYDAFVEWTAERGLALYPHQEEAAIELFDERNVVLATPTGSGKSMVAVAAHFAALAAGKRTYYTAPIKALVSEKFFDLCRVFGAVNVGMVTGDGSGQRPMRRSSAARPRCSRTSRCEAARRPMSIRS